MDETEAVTDGRRCGLCRECRHHRQGPDAATKGLGICQLSTRGHPITTALRAIPARGTEFVISTSSDFGCVQFEELEEHP